MKQPESSTQIDSFYPKIRNLLAEARARTVRTVNSIMVQTYWHVGKMIVEEEQKGKKRANYGSYLIKELSVRLQRDFGKGFDVSNLWNMRKLYVEFPILDAVRRELTWTHYRLLLRVENTKARQFYIDEAIENNWSTRSLERQINSLYFERLLSSKNKAPIEAEMKKNTTELTITDMIKEPYILEFVGLEGKPDQTEKNLEQALINKLQDFLLELGRGFSFVARQKRIILEDDHFYVDLVFYNYILKCFVLVELKTGKLTHQDIGQMDFYVRYYEKEIRSKDDNPTLGILRCTDKNDTMIKYTLLEDNNKVYASRYKLYLPTEDELKAELERERSFLNADLSEKQQILSRLSKEGEIAGEEYLKKKGLSLEDITEDDVYELVKSA